MCSISYILYMYMSVHICFVYSVLVCALRCCGRWDPSSSALHACSICHSTLATHSRRTLGSYYHESKFHIFELDKRARARERYGRNGGGGLPGAVVSCLDNKLFVDIAHGERYQIVRLAAADRDSSSSSSGVDGRRQTATVRFSTQIIRQNGALWDDS